jgi:flagellar hook-basal body complex protein FliE
MAIFPVSSIQGLPAIADPKVVGAPSRPGAFQAAFSDALRQVQSSQEQAQSSMNQFMAGEQKDVHEIALDAQKAELSFELFLQVRNKVVQAYQEIMRMQV